MKLTLFFISSSLSLVLGSAAAQTGVASFATPLAATGYAVGVDMVRNFKSQGVTFDLDEVIHGLRDAASGAAVQLSDAEIKRLVNELESDVRQKMVQARKLQAESNQKAGAEFLEKNAKNPAVTTLRSGLQYQVLKAGTGTTPVDGSTVVVNYRGQLVDGHEFDASPPGMPSTLRLSEIIPGWREALKLMPAGSKWQLAIPAALAYGERGAGRIIGPNQSLRFDVELLEVK
ncbi:FKBP-type peptidyl-prolyl cis-trans isomerase [Actimicrobium sp. CCI2.3]|uniref:FKBP-type peptidyl-prolyl cis-trans isomerase n=1 Tax=Actimicrobium sp. CCI2.3 TaxID=3048616 RepID=UPI002AB424D0|nr:FKBP-type peptidyl-prolyl cis-trans isomerase [Actimicrobium sp. CCI2.3]MDY7574588.1 FKBP-type peptidyl-prolyl cis-trans isomerase [Actimicrobium sp. CCI2.3]MEB0020964.1 FKBP-type peptidyl-prolyl cis-trans isomerase [Actimicrobium sp. CCI2.3]